MGMNLKLEGLRRVIKVFHQQWKCIFFICEFSFGIWREIACHLHSECTLTMLVNQFRESEILIQVGHGNEFELGGPWEDYKMMSWGMEMNFDHL